MKIYLLIALVLSSHISAFALSAGDVKKELSRRATLVKMRSDKKLDRAGYYKQLYLPVSRGAKGGIIEAKKARAKLLSNAKKTKSKARRKQYLKGSDLYKKYVAKLTEVISFVDKKQYFDLNSKIFPEVLALEKNIVKVVGSRPKRSWIIDAELVAQNKKKQKGKSDDKKKSKEKDTEKDSSNDEK